MRTSLRHLISNAAMITFVMAAFVACVKEEPEENSGLGAGDGVPVFSVTLNDGSSFSDRTIRGKVGVIEFFNTSCGDCRESLPVLQELYESRKAENGIIIAAIAREEGEEDIARFWESHGLTVPYSQQTDRRVYNLFATVGIPRIYVVSPEGIITAAYGPEDAPSLSQLESDVAKAKR